MSHFSDFNSTEWNLKGLSICSACIPSAQGKQPPSKESRTVSRECTTQLTIQCQSAAETRVHSALHSGGTGQQLEDIWILPSRKHPPRTQPGAPFDRSNGIYSLTSLPGTKSRKDLSDTASCSAEHPLMWGLQERGFGPRELRCERCSVSHELGNHDLAEHRESIWAPEHQQDRDKRHSLGQNMGVKR